MIILLQQGLDYIPKQMCMLTAVDTANAWQLFKTPSLLR